MLRSFDKLTKFSLLARDGEIGSIDDFYFDDEVWTTRYVVAQAGNWLTGRRVLLSPLAFEPPLWEERRIPVRLTRQQIKSSPPIDLKEPISRQQEMQLHHHYDWLAHHAGGGLFNETTYGLPADSYVRFLTRATRSEAAEAGDGADTGLENPHLRSSNEVTGYHIQATDDDIGHVDDFLIDESTWRIEYLVIDTRNWLPGKKVLVSPRWIKAVDWLDKKVHVDLRKDEVKDSPEYDPRVPLDRAYERTLHDYYGRPTYWL